MAASRYPSDVPADAGLLTAEQVSKITQLSKLQLYRIAQDPRQARRMGVERLAGSVRFRDPRSKPLSARSRRMHERYYYPGAARTAPTVQRSGSRSPALHRHADPLALCQRKEALDGCPGRTPFLPPFGSLRLHRCESRYFRGPGKIRPSRTHREKSRIEGKEAAEDRARWEGSAEVTSPENASAPGKGAQAETTDAKSGAPDDLNSTTSTTANQVVACPKCGNTAQPSGAGWFCPTCAMWFDSGELSHGNNGNRPKHERVDTDELKARVRILQLSKRMACRLTRQAWRAAPGMRTRRRASTWTMSAGFSNVSDATPKVITSPRWSDSTAATSRRRLLPCRRWRETSRSSQPKRETWTPIIADLQAFPPPVAHPALGKMDMAFAYRNAKGEVIGLVCRWEAQGGRPKEIRQLCYCRNEAGQQLWHWQGMPAPRLPWGTDLLAQNPGASVVVLEGEKKTLVMRERLKEAGASHVAVSLCGGANGIRKMDFSPLFGRDVTMYPDNNLVGRDAMREVAGILQANGCTVRMIEPPAETPDGGDVADLDPASWPPARIRELVESAKKWKAESSAVSPNPPKPNDLVIPATAEDAGIRSSQTTATCASSPGNALPRSRNETPLPAFSAAGPSWSA